MMPAPSSPIYPVTVELLWREAIILVRDHFADADSAARCDGCARLNDVLRELALLTNTRMRTISTRVQRAGHEA